MRDRSGSEPADIADLVDDLESTLRSLREVVEGDAPDRERRSPRRTPPRPPSLGDLVRFTERYTIPALVASLEATIRALELFRAVLRLADPERDLDAGVRDDGRSGVDVAGDLASATGTRAASELRRRLTDLREELAAADQPRNEEARDILQEARELTDELERRLREAGADDGGVTIDVDGGDGADSAAGNDEGGTATGTDDDPPGGTVDVDAELSSIKEDLGKAEASAGDSDADDDVTDGNDAGDSSIADDAGDSSTADDASDSSTADDAGDSSTADDASDSSTADDADDDLTDDDATEDGSDADERGGSS